MPQVRTLPVNHCHRNMHRKHPTRTRVDLFENVVTSYTLLCGAVRWHDEVLQQLAIRKVVDTDT